MITNTRIQTYTLNNLPGVQTKAFCITIQLVKVGHAQRQIGVGKQLDRLGFGGVSKQRRNVLLQSPFLQQRGKALSALRTLANHDTRRMQVVVQRATFTQELRREENIIDAKLLFNRVSKTDRNGGFDDHYRIGVNGKHIADNGLDAGGVEVVSLRIVISRCRDNYVIRITICIVLISRCTKIKLFRRQVLFDLFVNNRGFFLVQHLDLRRDDIQSHHFMVLGNQNTVRQTYITCS